MIHKKYYQRFIVIPFSALLTIFLSSDSYSYRWTKTFGGDSWDVGYSVQQTTDGGFIIVGYTMSCGAGSADVYLIKTDGSGNLVWDKTFGGSSWEEGYCVQQTTDKGFIIAGGTKSFGAGGYDVYLIKTDALGNLAWEKTFGGSQGDVGLSVQQTTDGGFIIAGDTGMDQGNSDVCLIKTDGYGNLVWDKTFGDSSWEEGYSVQQTTDGGFIIAGGTGVDKWNSDVYLIKTDALGNLAWEKTFGGSQGDVGLSVQQTTDDGYIIGGFTTSYNAKGGDVLLIKTDGSGDLVWDSIFGGSGKDVGYAIQQTKDNGFIIAGETVDDLWNLNIYLIKTDGYGNLVWEKALKGGIWSEGYSVRQTLDGGFIIAGYTMSYSAKGGDVYLIYYNEAWKTVYRELFDSPSDLDVMRHYRDEFLSNTTRGVIYKTLLYKFSEDALEVLLRNPELMSQENFLIRSSRNAVREILDGYEGILYNTDEIIDFLNEYAQKSPPILKILAFIVKWDMLRKQEREELFLGFRLK